MPFGIGVCFDLIHYSEGLEELDFTNNTMNRNAMEVFKIYYPKTAVTRVQYRGVRYLWK